MANLLDKIPWARRLKMRHLEVFLAVHTTGTLTAAATQLNMSQPALSHWLADIEEVVGRPLFLRKRRLTLTDDGEVLRAHAGRMLGDLQRTHEDLQAVRSGLQGRIHVGTGLPRVLLPKAIIRLHQDKPGIFVGVIEGPMPELLDKLVKREVDLIIGALSVQALRSGFETEALMPDSLQVVARRGHPLLRLKKPKWEATTQYPWILPPAGSVMRTIFDQAFAARKLKPPVPCVEANSSIRFQLLMGDANYLSILSISEVEVYRPLGIVNNVPLSPVIRSPDIGAIWAKDRAGPVMSHFLDALRHEARSMRRVK